MKLSTFHLFFFILNFLSFSAFSQVGINTNTPDASSMLEISATNKGLLIPRVALLGYNDITTIPNPAPSLLVYNDNPLSGMPRGFFYFNGSQWQALDRGEAWRVSGNVIADTTQFVGTQNSIPLILKTKNRRVGLFYPTGGIALGFNADAQKESGVALGRAAFANGPQNIAIGTGANSGSSNSMAMGSYATSTGNYGVAIGTQANVTSENTVAIGHLARALKPSTVSIGAGSKATEEASLGLGAYAEATAYKSVALGANAKATAENSFALGVGAQTTKPNTFIIGEVAGGMIEVTPLNVGIGTLDPKARMDVHGQFKMGDKGTVHKALSSFTHSTTTGITLDANGSKIISIPVPLAAQLNPGDYIATIHATLDPYFPDNVVLSWVRFNGTDNKEIRMRIKNESISPITITAGRSIHITIHDF